MELKTKEDFIKAFIACGKKYGFCMQEDAPSYKLYNFSNDIPSNIGDEKLYITRKPMYVKAGSDVEHVTEVWNHSLEEYEKCLPHDVVHHYTDIITKVPVFAWFVKPSYIKDGKIYHIVTSINGTQYNQCDGKIWDYNDTRSFRLPDIWRDAKNYGEDFVSTKEKKDSVYDSRNDEPIKADTNIFLQNNKLYAYYPDHGWGHTAEVELTDDWRAFTTYSEVLEFQKQETERLFVQMENDNIPELEKQINEKIQEIVSLSKDTVKLIKEFKAKTNTGKSSHDYLLEDIIRDYENFNFNGAKWFKCRNYM